MFLPPSLTFACHCVQSRSRDGVDMAARVSIGGVLYSALLGVFVLCACVAVSDLAPQHLGCRPDHAQWHVHARVRGCFVACGLASDKHYVHSHPSVTHSRTPPAPPSPIIRMFVISGHTSTRLWTGCDQVGAGAWGWHHNNGWMDGWSHLHGGAPIQ